MIMPAPFPGMNPYLEDPTIWRGFHHGFAEEIRAQLNQTLSFGYYADLEVHRVLPETEQHKLRTIQVRRTDTHQLVTAIEILSPYNKRGDWLDLYRAKRWRLIRSDVHLVELDLLRGGSRPGPELQNPPIITDYVILLNRYNPDGNKRRSEIWPVALSEPLPACPIPLLPPDPDTVLALNDVMANVYERSAYGRRLDYSQPVPPPPLRLEMEDWLTEHLKTNSS
jgi:hypothetical protein